MRIDVVAVGRLKEKYWRAAQDEYVKRLGGYAKTAVREVAGRDPQQCGGVRQALEREAQDLLSALPGGSRVVLLALDGKPWTSEGLSTHLEDLKLRGTSSFAFVVGGSHGVADAVRERADEMWSLGPATLPHELARIVVLEQVYRAFRIARGEPYHK